jgi:hypothetical protein
VAGVRARASAQPRARQDGRKSAFKGMSNLSGGAADIGPRQGRLKAEQPIRPIFAVLAMASAITAFGANPEP